jgi:hypothetical protein
MENDCSGGAFLVYTTVPGQGSESGSGCIVSMASSPRRYNGDNLADVTGLFKLARSVKSARSVAELLPAGDDPELFGRFGARN